MAHKALHQPATQKTPEVHFDPDKGELLLKGRSVHENSDKFYAPIFEMLERYAASPNEQTQASFQLEYFNTSSAKYILDIIKKLEEISLAGKRVGVKWYFEIGDLDMQEAGRDYADLVELEFSVEQI